MSERSETDRLAGHAIGDAERLTPAFSEALHARVMRAVRSGERAEPLRIHPMRWPIVRAAAAVVIVAGALWAMRLIYHPTVQVVRPTPTNPLRQPVPPQAFALLDSAGAQLQARAAQWQDTIAENQWAGLDHDVKRATRFLLDQLPLQPPIKQK